MTSRFQKKKTVKGQKNRSLRLQPRARQEYKSQPEYKSSVQRRTKIPIANDLVIRPRVASGAKLSYHPIIRDDSVSHVGLMFGGSEFLAAGYEMKAASHIISNKETNGTVSGEMAISPMFLGNRVKIMCNLFSEYAIRFLRIRYIPTVATTKAGTMVMNLHCDPTKITTGGMGYSNVVNDPAGTAINGAMIGENVKIFPVRESCALQTRYDGPKFWRTFTAECFEMFHDTVLTNIEDVNPIVSGTVPSIPAPGTGVSVPTSGAVLNSYLRDTCQYGLSAYNLTQPAITSEMGYFFVDYVIEFRGPTNAQRNLVGLIQTTPNTDWVEKKNNAIPAKAPTESPQVAEPNLETELRGVQSFRSNTATPRTDGLGVPLRR